VLFENFNGVSSNCFSNQLRSVNDSNGLVSGEIITPPPPSFSSADANQSSGYADSNKRFF
jgi:hypothetical protein